ncbi:ogfod2 [Symbiodinium pilosum]|uniref:Ogfod2 protein n=1 Tax=Symbiodinium pilosum TaxID=2952 RepID=A0A812XI37_SYMPI|nr:ogfod2 [Symbiodinium pilosum]
MGLGQDRHSKRSREEAEMSTRATSSTWWTCQCRVTHNYFVKCAGRHFMYRGDDVAFYQEHGSELEAAGCDAAEVLADLRRQREERIAAPDRTLERVDKIAQGYIRLHPEVYILDAASFLDPGFLKVVQDLRTSGPAAANIAGLKSAGLLQELRPGIWTFPVFTRAFCDALESELSHFRASGLPRSAPNTMNRHGIIMSELGFEELLDPLVFEYVNVLASRLLPAFTEFLDSYRGFTVLYEAVQDGDKGLDMHYDNSEVTLNVNVGGTWEGGHVEYYGLATSREDSPPFEVALRKGHGVFHAGLELHKALPIISGTRHNLILWCRSSGIRNDMCPMCFRQPQVIPTNRHHHEGFTVPPCEEARLANDPMPLARSVSEAEGIGWQLSYDSAGGCVAILDETLSSLRFATRAKNVRNVAKVNYTYSPEQLLVLVGKLHKQLLGANQHIVQLGGSPQEAPTDEAEKCATLCATSSTRSLRRPSFSGKGPSISEEAFSAQASASSLRPVSTGVDLSEPELAQAVHDVQKEDDDDDDVEAMSLHLYDEVFRPFALSAQKAISSLEEALLAQEKSLAEVRLLHAQREDNGHDRF